jgi:hypothetical protein
MALRSLWEYRALSIVFMSRQLAVGVGNVRTASRSPQPAELPRSFSASLATGVGHSFRPRGVAGGPLWREQSGDGEEHQRPARAEVSDQHAGEATGPGEDEGHRGTSASARSA